MKLSDVKEQIDNFFFNKVDPDELYENELIANHLDT